MMSVSTNFKCLLAVLLAVKGVDSSYKTGLRAIDLQPITTGEPIQNSKGSWEYALVVEGSEDQCEDVAEVLNDASYDLNTWENYVSVDYRKKGLNYVPYAEGCYLYITKPSWSYDQASGRFLNDLSIYKGDLGNKSPSTIEIINKEFERKLGEPGAKPERPYLLGSSDDIAILNEILYERAYSRTNLKNVFTDLDKIETKIDSFREYYTQETRTNKLALINVQKSVDNTATDLAEVNTTVANTATDLAEMKATVTSIAADLAGVKASVASVANAATKEDIAELKALLTPECIANRLGRALGNSANDVDPANASEKKTNTAAIAVPIVAVLLVAAIAATVLVMRARGRGADAYAEVERRAAATQPNPTYDQTSDTEPMSKVEQEREELRRFKDERTAAASEVVYDAATAVGNEVMYDTAAATAVSESDSDGDIEL